jgi:hypothetical protein
LYMEYSKFMRAQSWETAKVAKIFD